jgi:hypothetical protein
MFIGPFNIMKEKEEELKAKFFEISFSVHSKLEGEIHFSVGRGVGLSHPKITIFGM